VAAHAASKKSAAADVQVFVLRLVAAGSKCFGQVSWSGSWLAGPTCSIKYEFMFFDVDQSRLTAKPIAWPKFEFRFLNLSLVETLIAVCESSDAYSYEKCDAQASTRRRIRLHHFGFRKLKVILLEQVALAPDVYGLSLMEIIGPIGKHVSTKCSRGYGECHERRRSCGCR
jgi:hypothetical protein